MAVDIRPAREQDIDSIQAVASEAWQAAHEPIIGAEKVGQFIREYYDDESFQSRIDDDGVLLSVAESREAGIVGFVTAVPGDDGASYDLNQLYVRPDYWEEGIGSKLLSRVEQRIEANGGERITLGVMAENERAVRFYESAGYEYSSTFHDDFIDTQSYVYEKPL